MTTMVTKDRWKPAQPAISFAASKTVSLLPDLADVRGIVSRALSQAKSTGRDELTQTRAAALAVIAVRPDVTLSQAFSAIARMQAAGAV